MYDIGHHVYVCTHIHIYVRIGIKQHVGDEGTSVNIVTVNCTEILSLIAAFKSLEDLRCRCAVTVKEGVISLWWMLERV